jgi:hypothetical protein
MEEALEHLFTIFLIGFILWVLICTLIFYARLKFAQYIAKEKVNKVKRQHQVRKGGDKKVKEVVKSKDTPHDKYYEIAKTTFNCAMKNGQLTRKEILGVKDLLNQMLTGTKKYDSYYFKNDCHEVYVKLKDGNLGMLEYQKIVDLILNNKGV